MNMSYCRFQNTLIDLRDCAQHLRSLDPADQMPNTIEERQARAALLRLGADMLAEVGITDTDDTHAIDAAIFELDREAVFDEEDD
jgi:hypothetical protein